MTRKVEFGTEKVKLSNFNREVVQDLGGDSAQLPMVNQQIDCLTPMTFTQKLYQSYTLETVESNRDLAFNSIGKVKKLLENLLELSADI